MSFASSSQFQLCRRRVSGDDRSSRQRRCGGQFIAGEHCRADSGATTLHSASGRLEHDCRAKSGRNASSGVHDRVSTDKPSFTPERVQRSFHCPGRETIGGRGFDSWSPLRPTNSEVVIFIDAGQIAGLDRNRLAVNTSWRRFLYRRAQPAARSCNRLLRQAALGARYQDQQPAVHND